MVTSESTSPPVIVLICVYSVLIAFSIYRIVLLTRNEKAYVFHHTFYIFLFLASIFRVLQFSENVYILGGTGTFSKIFSVLAFIFITCCILLVSLALLNLYNVLQQDYLNPKKIKNLHYVATTIFLIMIFVTLVILFEKGYEQFAMYIEATVFSLCGSLLIFFSIRLRNQLPVQFRFTIKPLFRALVACTLIFYLRYVALILIYHFFIKKTSTASYSAMCYFLVLEFLPVLLIVFLVFRPPSNKKKAEMQEELIVDDFGTSEDQIDLI
ncbi:hypothetical protein M0812_18301 [Anaeramoeba flamelloides]|uniref:THH1/TOM1/TOM3 domain-containing protein n=1 Tax=Anaeramoeba flamelloides TaxID=1746091 RepID=A0AAV7Z350_9EUKA|nr:hypothetical protein M0812_18301 [Anaeramoeba flamelloides]